MNEPKGRKSRGEIRHRSEGQTLVYDVHCGEGGAREE